MITDEEIDTLRQIAERVRSHADYSYYGVYNGGDPRDFFPDAETATDEERARWEADCAAWERGEVTETDPKVTGCHTNRYGPGVITMQDEELVKMAQDLDDWIDRVRQVAP